MPGGALDSRLGVVACPSLDMWIAAGSTDDRELLAPLVESWQG